MFFVKKEIFTLLQQEYRDLECEQTKGLYFFVDADMKSPTFRLDASGKALLTVLRHLSRIKEVGGQLKRYVIVPPS